ncbi:MAG: hypothetical protein NPINA01_29670 [Nitrospinaceae bacterium]|nr:MAG: hypothetical protein NPINA01_29670 [Nitrospinaceae bacterium]
MSGSECRECGKEISEELKKCPHCGTPTDPETPNYPTFGGSGWVMNVIGILFITLVVALLVSMFTFQD